MNDWRAHDMGADHLDQRRDPPSEMAHPVGHDHALDLDAVVAFVRFELLSESATATNQAPKLAPLIVREPPGSPSVAILDHNPSFVAGDDFKRAGRKGYSQCAPQ